MKFARSFTLLVAALVASIVAVLIVAQPKTTTTPRKITAPPEAPTPPIAFADPDGQALVLEELSVRTAIHGMLSLTEMELRFRNPQDRRIEGRFTCTLPQNAAISRFAKEVNGHLMEGEVVERLRANQVYEQFLHQMRDPALLEQDQGNRFSARIFPIEAKAPVRLLVSWTQLLPMRDGVRTYSLPLRGLSQIGKVSFRAFVTPLPGEQAKGTLTTSSAQVTSFDETNWTPDRDIVLEWRTDDSRARILRAGDFYLTAFRPRIPSATQLRAPSDRWVLYVDTSASSAEGSAHRIRALEEILGALPSGDRVEVIAFDQELVPLAKGSASDVARTLGDALRARLFLGGTDLGALLRDVRRRASADPDATIVVASDLVATLGRAASHEVKQDLDALPSNVTLHALILGTREDNATAKALTAGRGRIVRVPFTEELASRARAAVEDLRRPLGASIDVRDAAAEWIYPTHFDDVQPGDEVIGLAKVKPSGAPAPSFGTTAIDATTTALDSATFAPLLEREAYRAYLEYLAEREAAESNEGVRRALAAEQVKTSVEQRVVIPRTTMLVLESEFDYQRFGLDRRALAAILTIEAGGIGRVDRKVEISVPRPITVTANAPMRDRAAKSVVQPMEASAAVAPPPPSVEQEADAQAPMGFVGGVEGNVAGGVAGGTIGGVAPVQAAAPAPMAEVITEPARERRDQPRRITESKPQQPDWTTRKKPSRESVAELERQLRNDPRDRERYNQLGEALAALGEWRALRDLALQWQPYDPENPQVYELLGVAAEELGRETEAARAFASLIEVAPAKTELLQRAGLLLIRTGHGALAEAPLRRALELRPDRANGYRHLALLLWRDGRVEEAARVLETATTQSFPGWYGNVQRVIREELGSVYRAWMKKDESRRREIEQRAADHGVDLKRRDALRITLAWETDANDVDLHVVDPRAEEVFYSHRESRSGLELYEDITQGLGPEVVRTDSLERGTYHVGVKYFAAGPMGISRGVVIIVRNDDVEIHPFRLAKGGEDIRYVAAVEVK